MEKMDGNWSKITILEPVTGKFYNKYFYKRKPAHRIVIDTPKSRVLAGYTLIEKDLRSAIIWLEHIKSILESDPNFVDPKGHIKATYDRDKFNLIKGLFVAALTFYGKCFTTCEHRKVKLEKRNLDPKYLEAHDSAMDLRHNFAAHSGTNKYEKARTVIALDKKRKEPPYFVRELLQTDAMGLEDLNDFLDLFKHAKSNTEDKIKTLAEKVYKDDILSKGVDHWYSKV